MKTTKNIPYRSFYFVRHGETDWNKIRKVMGQIDIPLNDTGIKQAHTIAKSLAHLDIAHIVSGPLKRTIKTAEIIAETIQAPITIIEEFKNAFGGSMEGKHKDDYPWIEQWFENWSHGKSTEGIEKDEPWRDFVSRVNTGLKKSLDITNAQQPIVIVGHGPTLWALLHILDIPVNMSAKNCDAYYFRPPDDKFNRWTAAGESTASLY